MTLVSIIIPNYNHAAYLEKRLDSVFHQSIQDFEVILLDDASTDNSREILSHYRYHPKVSHCLFNNTNSGSPFRQWKKGVELAKGRYIWIAESDDWAEKHFLESMLPRLSDHVGLAVCRSISYDDRTGELSNDFYPDILDAVRWTHDFLIPGQEEIDNYLIIRNTIPNASACLFDRKLTSFDDHILSMKFCGDWLFWARILSQTNYSYVAEPLNYFRYSEHSSRSVKDAKTEIVRFKEMCFCIDRISDLSVHQFLPARWYHWLFPMRYSRKECWKIPFYKKPITKIKQWDFTLYLIKDWFLEAFRRLSIRPIKDIINKS